VNKHVHLQVETASLSMIDSQRDFCMLKEPGLI